MTAVFIRILGMSLTAGYCITAVIVLRFLLRKKAKIFSYLLWGVVLFRLLCPFSITSSYSLLRMDPAVVSGKVYSGGQQEVWQGKGYLSDEMNGDGSMWEVPTSQRVVKNEETSAAQKVLAAGAWVWIAGAFVLLVYSVWTAARLRRFLAGACPVEERADGKAEERIYEMDGIATPFVYGLIRPRIYLPAHLQPEERRYVLAHERVHIARKDHLVKLIGWGAVCLHWFNPLVWLAFRLMESDMEMSCDEAVLRQLGEEVKQEYSRALLSLSCAESGFHASPVAFGEGGLKSRILNILNWKRGRIATAAALAVPVCALAAGLMLNPAGKNRTGEQLRFLDTYANAYCERNGDVVVGLYSEEEVALESVILLEKAGGRYTMGFSSPWPNEFRYILTENLGAGRKDGDSAEIWYYAWTSDPHVTVWKENLKFEETKEGYRVTDSSIRYLDSITSSEEFDEAYWIGGEYQFTDYEERGYLEAILYQTEYDRESGAEDRNAVYRSPDTAAAWIFNLEGGRCETLSNVSGKQAAVEYTFADGSSVQIPMYNVRYDGMTIATEESERELQVTEDIWIPDLHVWNAGAP